MQEYRSLDDSITTRMNRALAKSRATGETSSPSLLSAHATSSNPTTSDLGRSTYGTATQGECARFWRELVDVWTGRDEVLNYCLAVAAQAQGAAAASPAERLGLQRGNDDEKRLLDADLPRDVRGALDAVGQRQQRGAKADDFDSRDSRSEKSQDLVVSRLVPFFFTAAAMGSRTAVRLAEETIEKRGVNRGNHQKAVLGRWVHAAVSGQSQG
ncbi:hypothetical protein L7F22_023062 [Adiantum nelumboides]|nr:hypothetical protein [Adiantum nelumboides]